MKASITVAATRGLFLSPTARRGGLRGAGIISTDSSLNEPAASPWPCWG